MEFSSNDRLEKIQIREDIELTRKILRNPQIHRIVEILLEVPTGELNKIETILKTFRQKQ
ncbi:hypothetical protein LEP1GSC125_1859 [Leptospira mayottensis 200901122]|uniref:Uncharacterized protein n=2 Tax=Leptospira mayottensis TaxID=1137606 RepID=A0AA87MM02_9LEPT|nr:hypothetical protein LEP1GSC125_1859 [Leptospira mayottensis 200901122]